MSPHLEPYMSLSEKQSLRPNSHVSFHSANWNSGYKGLQGHWLPGTLEEICTYSQIDSQEHNRN